MAQDRRLDWCGKNNEIDVGGQEMVAILERDGWQEEYSTESIHLSARGKWKEKKGNSPDRLVKARGTEDVIKEMF